MYCDPKFSQREGGVSYIDEGRKRFRDTVPACILLRKNLRNGIPSQQYPCVNKSIWFKNISVNRQKPQRMQTLCVLPNAKKV
jgi:hypothetical protein